MATSQAASALWNRLSAMLISAPGITIVLTVIAAIIGTIDKGLYVLVNTIVIGGMWALMAMGLALGFSVMNVPNFAYGEFFMIGTLAAYYIFLPLNEYLSKNPHFILSLVAPLIAIFGAAVTGGVAGAITEKLVFFELRKRNREQWLMNCFLLTIAISVVMINGHQLIFGPDFKGIVKYWNVRSVPLLGVYISVDKIFAFVLVIVTLIIFWTFLKFSKTGKAIRAVSEDESGALMMGINYNYIQTLVMALSCGLSALAGGTLLFMFPSTPTVGHMSNYYAWFVVVLVGMGNIVGAVAGGFIVALLQVLTRVYVGEGFEFVIPTALMIVILVFIPSGIFGTKVRGVWDR